MCGMLQLEGGLLRKGIAVRILFFFIFLRCIHTLIGHQLEISNAVFNYDGKLIATGSMDRTCKLWDATTGKCLSTFRYGKPE